MTVLLPGLVLLPLIAGGFAALFRQQGRWITLATGLGMLVMLVLLSIDAWGVGQYQGLWTLGGWERPLAIAWYLDDLAHLMLLLVGLVSLAIMAYAWFDTETSDHFWGLWLGGWGAMNALLLSSDLFNIYVTIELLGLVAVALVALSTKAGAAAAAMRYLIISLTGSMFFLLGVALIYGQYGRLDLIGLAEVVEHNWVTHLAWSIMLLGLLAKTAAWPLHGWLPLAHGRAPTAASALLSALVIKASFYLMWRFGVGPFAALSNELIAMLLALLGTMAIFWGSWRAWKTPLLKELIAWSTVAQIGYLLIGLAILFNPQSILTVSEQFNPSLLLFWLIAAHALTKAGLFLVAGNLILLTHSYQLKDQLAVLCNSPLTLWTLGLGSVALAGLPLTLGFIGKWWLIESSVALGQFWLLAPLILGGVFTLAYMGRLLQPAFEQRLLCQYAPKQSDGRPAECISERQLAWPLLAVPFILVLSVWVLALFPLYPWGATL
ncbi:complex I subunit 5 family protein [Thiomicrospira sp. ALE5]|uniref:complex I subunit 5 family protein n=1 Tax=Thiomicrospira sp. ALE5 TaxID=748650 RepID=UPI0008E1FC6B|nr:proton-conducting transporter membrane subunit [Thiomicrospira sp. ALE5]SFR52981.1 Formate hydrogenlyase subunit 3/Multisubunit Na+/H+ antiporter, MnhD subunit [Thiomicrospira sp. ALE5]